MNQFYIQAVELFNRPIAADAGRIRITQQQISQKMSSRVAAQNTAEQLPKATVYTNSLVSLQSCRRMIEAAQGKVYQLAYKFGYQEIDDQVGEDFIGELFGLFFYKSLQMHDFIDNFVPRTLQTAYEIAIAQELFPFAKSADVNDVYQYRDVIAAYQWLVPIAREHRMLERCYPRKKQQAEEHYSFKPEVYASYEQLESACQARIEKLNQLLPEQQKITKDADFITRMEAQEKARRIKLQEAQDRKMQAEIAEIKQFQALQRPKQPLDEKAFEHFLETYNEFLETRRLEKPQENPELTFYPKISRKRSPNPAKVQVIGYEKAVARCQMARQARNDAAEEQSYYRLRRRTQRAATAEMSSALAQMSSCANAGEYVRPEKNVLKQIQVQLSGVKKVITVSFYENDSIASILDNLTKIYTLTSDQREQLKAELVKQFAQFDNSFVAKEPQEEQHMPYDQLFNEQQNARYAELRDYILRYSVQLAQQSSVRIDEADQFFF